MEEWKRALLVNAVEIRAAKGEGTVEKIVKKYTKLTQEEQEIILKSINS